jgi:DNA-binding MarR family transcriptional regulator
MERRTAQAPEWRASERPDGVDLDKSVDINISEAMSTQDELPFETTLRVRDTCLCLHVQRAARAVARRYDEALRPLGLTNFQFSLLMSINRPQPPSMGQVSALLAMDRTTLTANLKPLERRGLVTIAPDPDDRRSRLLTLTPAGRSLLAAAMPVWEKTQEIAERLVTQAGPDLLRADLLALS